MPTQTLIVPDVKGVALIGAYRLRLRHQGAAARQRPQNGAGQPVAAAQSAGPGLAGAQVAPPQARPRRRDHGVGHPAAGPAPVDEGQAERGRRVHRVDPDPGRQLLRPGVDPDNAA